MYWKIFFKPRLLTLGPSILLGLFFIVVEQFPRLFGLVENEAGKVLFTNTFQTVLLLGVILLVYLFSSAVYYTVIAFTAFQIMKGKRGKPTLRRRKP